VAKRLLRVNEALRETLSQAIGEGLKDPRVGFVTVTGVETSPDLRHAKVFVSVLGGKKEREQTLAGLASSHGHLQERIAAAVRLKRTPQLVFLYDDSVDRGMRMEMLLKRYEEELGPQGGEEAPAVGAESDPGHEGGVELEGGESGEDEA
jgi:ribosome-binding factor A